MTQELVHVAGPRPMHVYIYKQGHDIREMPRHIQFKASYSRWTTGEQIPNVFEFWFWIKKWRRGSISLLCLLITDYNTSLSWHLSVWNIYIYTPPKNISSLDPPCMMPVSEDEIGLRWLTYGGVGSLFVKRKYTSQQNIWRYF